MTFRDAQLIGVALPLLQANCAQGEATLSEYRQRAASPVVPTNNPMADQDMPDSRAIRMASIMWRSASEVPRG